MMRRVAKKELVIKRGDTFSLLIHQILYFSSSPSTQQSPVPSLPQGSQDSSSGQEGPTPPFSVFPPLPPQNGMSEAEFNAGTMFAAGSQSATDIGTGGNGGTPTATSNSVSQCVFKKKNPFIFECVYMCKHRT